MSRQSGIPLETGKKGKYIYCIIESNQSQSFGPLGIGGRGDELRTILYDDISAVVSDSPVISYSVSRENMLAHEKAIEEIMKKHTVLPVRFCTIAKNEDKVKKILEKEHDRFIELLKNIEGKKEFGLKAIFPAEGGLASGGKENIYSYILEKYTEIKKLKKTIALKSPVKTYYQRMEIGKMVENALQKEKDIHKEEILNTLSPLAVETKTNNTYGELMIINAAFLVEKYRETEFDQEVNELAKKYGSKIKFKYVTEVPPFNFVNLVIETGRY